MPKKLQIKTLKLTMAADKYKIILKAIKKLKQQTQQDVSDSRALELIAISYLLEPEDNEK